MSRIPGAETTHTDLTRSASSGAPKIPRPVMDLEIVAMALAPERWASLIAHLDPALLPDHPPGSSGPDDRAARLARFAHLLRSRTRRGERSASDRQVFAWHPPSLALLQRPSSTPVVVRQPD